MTAWGIVPGIRITRDPSAESAIHGSGLIVAHASRLSDSVKSPRRIRPVADSNMKPRLWRYACTSLKRCVNGWRLPSGHFPAAKHSS